MLAVCRSTLIIKLFLYINLNIFSGVLILGRQLRDQPFLFILFINSNYSHCNKAIPYH